MKRTALLALLLGLPFVAAAGRAGEGEVETGFLSERTTVWLDRTQVIPFELPAPAADDVRPAASSSDDGVLAIVRAPEVLAGETTGYLRVRGLAEGSATLTVGDSALDVAVRPAPVDAFANSIRARVTGLVPGAVAWGTFAVGVEVTGGTELAQTRAAEVRLRLSNGDELEPVSELPIEYGPARRLVFEVDAEELFPGEATATAVVYPDGAEPVESASLTFTIARPAAEDVLTGECEDHVATPRPEGFGDTRPRVGSGPGASGDGFVSVGSTWLLPVEVGETGRYQMMVVARGDFGAGAFPSLGLDVDAYRDTATTVRLVDRHWRRMPLGYPIELEAGERLLAINPLNRLNLTNTAQRTAFLDRFELLRIDEPEDGASGGMMMMSAATSLGSGSGMEADYGASSGSGGLWIAFEQPFDGLQVTGRLAITGTCRWDGADETPAPQVDFLINGRVVASHQAAAPLFGVDRAAFLEGENTVQMVASLPDGRRASTPIQTVSLVGDPNIGCGQGARAWHRFAAVDDRWREALQPYLHTYDNRAGHLVARFVGASKVELALPDELEGPFIVIFEARGPDYQHAARYRFTVTDADGERAVGEERDLHGWWQHHYAGELDLAAGPKTITFERLDDGDEDPGVLLRSVILQDRWPDPDRCAPRSRIVYPRAGHAAHGLDAVIVEAFDDSHVEQADLLIDGRRQYSFARVRNGFGHVVLPLILRGIEPGEHVLAVRVVDEAGNLGESEELPFTVLAEPPAERGPFTRAVHLLDRFAYGPEPQELADVLTMGERAWLDASLAEAGAGDAAALGFARTDMQTYGNYQTVVATLQHVLRTDNPARTRFVQWVENHFSTWINKAGGPAEWYEHDRFLRLGAAPFQELLVSSSTSPGMLCYLDQQESYAGRLNENYAREIMELHTLGVDGGYTQEEVTSLAGLLAGVTLTREANPTGEGEGLTMQLRFAPDLGDARPREILGMRFGETPPVERFDRLNLAIELLAAHPSTARYVCGKLAAHYVAVPPPEALVDDLTAVFTESGGDMRAVLLALAEHPAFWDEDLPEKIANPFDFAVRIARVCDSHQVYWAVNNYLNRAGMGVFDRATPDGYPEEDAAWVDTNGTMQRWSFARDIPWAIQRVVPRQLHGEAVGDVEFWQQRVIDVGAFGLTGDYLSDESNAAAREFFATAEGPPWERVGAVSVFLTRLPEVSFR